MKMLVSIAAVVLLLATNAHAWTVHMCPNNPLGLALPNPSVEDSQLSATSSLNSSYGPDQARLGAPRCWIAAGQDQERVLTVNLTDTYYVTGFKIQGCHGLPYWTTVVGVGYSCNGVIYEHLGNFSANVNADGIVHVRFNHSIIAAYLQFRIIDFAAQPAMRLEIIVCPQSPRVQVRCSKSGMALWIPKAMLLPLQANQMQLRNRACMGTEVTVDQQQYYFFNTSLTGCNTTCYVSSQYIHYVNVASNLLGHLPGAIIHRLRRVRVLFSCTYRLIKVITPQPIEPDLSVLMLSQHAFGKFGCYMNFFKDVGYQNMYPPISIINIALQTRIYVRIRLDTGDPHLVINVRSCWATPQASPGSMPFYFLLRNGVIQDPTFVWHNGIQPLNGLLKHFSFESFVLLKNHRFIYIHCQMVICKGRTGLCTPQNRKRDAKPYPRRLGKNEQIHTLNSGPIVLNTKPEDVPQKAIKQDAIKPHKENLLKKTSLEEEINLEDVKIDEIANSYDDSKEDLAIGLHKARGTYQLYES